MKYVILILIAIVFGIRFMTIYRGELDTEEILDLGVIVTCFLIMCYDMFTYIATTF